MNLIIESLKSKHEIIQILKENTHEDIPILKVMVDDNVFNKFFRGTISDDSFKIQRFVTGQMGYVPLSYGTITFLLISIIIVNTKFFFIPLGMLIYGFLLHYVTYKIESKKAIVKLQEIFN